MSLQNKEHIEAMLAYAGERNEQRTRAERAKEELHKLHRAIDYSEGNSDFQCAEYKIQFVVSERDTLRKQLEEARTALVYFHTKAELDKECTFENPCSACVVLRRGDLKRGE